MDLVSHYLQVQRVSGSRILVLWLVAENTHLHAVSVAAMECQLVVAGITALGLDDIASDCNRRAIRNEVEGCARVVGPEVECREVAVAVYGYRGGCRGVESSRRLSDEGVLILARSHLGCFPAQLEVRTRDGTQSGTGRLSSSVRDILFLAFGNVSRDIG